MFAVCSLQGIFPSGLVLATFTDDFFTLRVYLTYLHYVYDPSAVLYQLYKLQLFGFCYYVEIFEQDHTEILTCPLKTEQFISWKAKCDIDLAWRER